MSEFRLIAPLAALLLAAACASFGEQGTRAVPLDAAALKLPEHHAAAPVSPQWWRALNDNTLNRLIDAALSRSPDLAAAQARLHQAEAGSRYVDSQGGIQVGLTAQPGFIHRENLGNEQEAAQRLPSLDSSRFGLLNLAGQWTWDLWGKHKNEIAAALGRQKAAEYEIAQTRLILAQAVAAQYVQWQGLQAQQQLLQERLAVNAQQQNLIGARIKAGLLPASQLYPLQSAQHQLQAALRSNAEQTARTRHALAALTARPAQALDAELPEKAGMLPQPPVSRLSADLLGKRPDLAAQREAVLAHAHLIDAAKAEFYPNIQIKALAGLSSIKIGDLSASNGLVGALLPSVTLPIFTSGALQANLKQKNAEFDEQVSRYNRSVYQALREAADALSQYEWSQQARSEQAANTAVLQKSAAALQKRVQAGLENKLALLNAQEQIIQSKSAQSQAEVQQRLGWIALNAAFGGGFEAAKPAH